HIRTQTGLGGISGANTAVTEPRLSVDCSWWYGCENVQPHTSSQGAGMSKGHFCWVDLASHGITASVEWYGALFGWTLGSVDDNGGQPYGMLKSGEDVVAGIGEVPEAMHAQMPSVWNNYVAVDSCVE